MSSSNDIEKLIQIYLYQRKYVSLPGIGTFKIERIKPKDVQIGKYLWGPIHKVHLDAKIDSGSNDIFAYIAKKMNLTEWEAVKLVNEFVSNLKSAVRKDSKYRFNGLGDIEMNEDGSFRLHAETIQYSFYTRITKPNADFIPSPVETDIVLPEIQQEVVESIEYPEDIVQKDRWWIAVLVFAILSILCIIISLTRTDIPFGGRQSRTEVQTTPIQYE